MSQKAVPLPARNSVPSPVHHLQSKGALHSVSPMESNSEGHPSTFSRLAKAGSSPTSFPNMSHPALRLPAHLEQLRPLLGRGANEALQVETQQPSSDDLPVLKAKDISNMMRTAAADIGYASDLASPAAVPQFEDMRDMHIGLPVVDPSFGHNSSVQLAQAQAAFPIPNMYNDQLPQPEAATAVLPVHPLQNIAEFSHHQQLQNFHYPTNYPTNSYNYPAAATSSQNPYRTDPVGATESSPMMARYAGKLPPWRKPDPRQAQPVSFPGFSVETMPVRNSFGEDIILAREDTPSLSGHVHGQPIGNPLADPNVVNIPSSEVPPIRTYTEHAGNVEDHTQTVGNGGSSLEYQKESIDVDNEANNICGGVNWKMPNELIDLSNDTKELPKLKKGRKKEEEASKQQPPGYRIPHKSSDAAPKLGDSTSTSNQVGSNDGAGKTRFVDPLCLPRRRDTGPPVRPFPSSSPANSPVRRSPRHKKSESRKADLELTDSSKQAQPSDANVDVPLGGLGKSAKDLNTEASGFRGRNRSNNKRRRPNGGTEVEGPAKKSDGNCRTEKRGNTTTVDKRRTKPETRKKKSRKQAPTKPRTKTFTEEVATNEDSDDDYFEMMRNKKVPTISNRRPVPAQSQGDSPQSNTVGDVSQSDDESVGAVGNELSSDDDDGDSVNISPRQRHIQRQEVSEAITISDSPVQPQKPRKPRKSKTIEASRGVASKSRQNEAVYDSDGEHFSASPKDCAHKTNKKFDERNPRGHKRMKRAKTPSSPVNLVSPTPSGLERKSVRRSPRNAKERPSGKQRADDLVANSSDDDFEDSRVSARTRGKTKRHTPANETSTRSRPKERRSALQHGAESEDKLDRVEKTDTGIDLTDEEPKSPNISPSDEDCDVAAEFPSQDQGSQPIDLKVKIVPKRKKAGPRVFLEREFLKLSTDELSIIRVAFIKRYPSPPSNMQAQGRYEAAHGTAMTSGMVQRTWETQLKPWSERWWDFYLDFNNKVREKKAAKPRNKDPTLKESEVKSWVEEYYREHGDARPNVSAAGSTTTEAAATTDMEPQ